MEREGVLRDGIRCEQGDPQVKKMLVENLDLRVASVQAPARPQIYMIENKDGIVSLCPEKALQVAQAILEDLSYRPWSPEGAKAVTLLGRAFKNPRRKE